MKTQEKLIINQMLCLLGIKSLAEFIKKQVLETYVKIEKRHQFRNKGLLYLLNMFNQDVSQMLSKYRYDKVKEVSLKNTLRKEENEKEFSPYRSLQQPKYLQKKTGLLSSSLSVGRKSFNELPKLVSDNPYSKTP